MATFDAETTESHRIARLSFVPWLARFLGGGTTRQKAPELAVGDAHALTDETVKAIQEIANLACWRFLIRECGWRKIEAVSRLDSEEHSARRMLQEGEQGLPKLTFTTATLDLLINVFNATGPVQSITLIDMPDCLLANGDLILHHLVFRRISRDLVFERIFNEETGHRWLQWYTNPLNAIFDPIGYHSDYPVKLQWQPFLSAELTPFLPWVGEYLYPQVRNRMPLLWAEQSVQESLIWLETTTLLAKQWLDAVESIERPDFQCCLFDLMIHHCNSSPEILARFEALHVRETIQVRQTRAEVWNAFIELSEILFTTFCKCAEIHPVERTAAQKCFLARWEATEFEHYLKQFRELSQTLRPAFN